MLAQEWRTQRRSLRFRLGLVFYLLLAIAPALAIFFLVQPRLGVLLGDHSYLGQVFLTQPLAAALLAILVAGNGSSRAALDTLWVPLASARLSSIEYLVQRWLAQQVILWPAMLVPLGLVAGLTWAAGTPPHDPVTWLGQWALMVLPVPAVVGALWLGISVMAGSELVALLMSFVGLTLFGKLLAWLFTPWRMLVDGILSGLRIDDLMGFLTWLVYWFRHPQDISPPGLVASQGVSDLASTWQWIVARNTLAWGLAVLCLSLAAAFLGRTRRDLQPLAIDENHALRSYLALFNRLRQRYAPDACLGRLERLALAMAVVLLVGAVFFHWRLQRGYQVMAEARYETVKGWTHPPLPTDVVVEAWKVDGELASSGHLRSETQIELLHSGDEPLGQLVFSLNADLQVEDVEAAGHRVQSHRQWDRWVLELAPPLAPGERLHLRAEVQGKPADPFFGFYRGNTFRSFVDGFEAYRGARFASGWKDFSRTQPRPAASRRRVDLTPADLGPVPSFTTWQLTPPSKDPSRFGQQVPEEVFPITTDLEMHLVAPTEWQLVDACGALSRSERGVQVLASQCRGSLRDYVVRGGRFVMLEDAALGLTLGMLPGHEARGRSLLQGLASAVALSDRAWPGLQGLRSLVVIDWPPRFDVDLMKGMTYSWWEPFEEELNGALLSLPEPMVVSERPLRPERLVGRVMARDLLRRRALDPTQVYLFQHLFAGLTIRRMGLDDNGAVFSASPWGAEDLNKPLLGATPENVELLQTRLPAVMAEAEQRVGSHHFYAAIEAFLARQDGPPGTVQELFESLESRSGVSLESFFEEHFEQGSLPFLTLRATRRRTEEGAWETHGSLTNKGSGQSTCPIVVSTEVGEEQLVVTVDAASSTPFSLITATPPLGAVLDPQRTCLRIQYRVSQTLERVDLVGTENGPQ